jgi:SEC-C motif
MTQSAAAAFDVEQGLIELPGTPARWIWAFTCPTPKCACRAAIVLSAPGDRQMLLERGRPVAEAWLGRGHHGEAAQHLKGVAAFAIDLDTLELFPPVGNTPLDAAAHPEVSALAARFDDDVLDAVAQLWHRGKGESPPPGPSADEATIEIEGWRPGDLVVWDEAQPFLRGDTFVLGERIFEAIELYCVEPESQCGKVIIDFSSAVPRGAPHPGHVEFDGQEAMLHPEHERQRERLTELWTAYCRRHPQYLERFARRSSTMHGLAGRIAPAAPKPKVGHNEPCSCGSGKKFKKCCGTL